LKQISHTGVARGLFFILPYLTQEISASRIPAVLSLTLNTDTCKFNQFVKAFSAGEIINFSGFLNG